MRRGIDVRSDGPGRGILGTLFLVVFVDLVGFGMVIPLLPFYAERYEPSPWVFGLFMASYSLFQFLFAPMLGRLSDRVGRRPVMLVSLGGAAAGYFLLGVAGSLPVLFLSRIIAGAAGGNISTAQAVIADTTAPEGRAKGMGIIGAAFGLGFILGPFLGGLLWSVKPWLPGLAASGTSLAALGMAWALLPETHSLAARERPRRAPFDVGALSRALRHPSLGIVLVTFLLVVFGFANFETTFAQLVSKRFSLPPERISFFFFGMGILSAVVQGGLIGPLTRRFGEARLVLGGAALCFAAIGTLPYLKGIGPLAGAVGFLGLGFGVLNPSLSSLSSRLADPDEVGGVLGIYQGLGSLGRILGPFVAEVSFGAGDPWPFRIGSVAMLVAATIAIPLAARIRRSASA